MPAIPFFSYTQIELGSVIIYSWGLLLALAFLFGSLFFLYLAKKENFSENKILALSVLIVASGILGSRLGYVLQFPFYYFSNPLEALSLWQGGLMFYGGLVLAVLSGLIYIKKQKLDAWKIADILAPAAGLSIFIGRIGCFLIKDHPGAVTSLSWGILWPDGVIRHPVALYLSLNGLLIFLVFFWLYKKQIFQKGNLFILFIIWYNISRFLLDFTRAKEGAMADPSYWGLTVSQWLSLALILFVFIVVKKRWLQV
jgi:phosphatidylglycerol:prolipoprotein diacylglycerol transferase